MISLQNFPQETLTKVEQKLFLLNTGLSLVVALIAVLVDQSIYSQGAFRGCLLWSALGLQFWLKDEFALEMRLISSGLTTFLLLFGSILWYWYSDRVLDMLDIWIVTVLLYYASRIIVNLSYKKSIGGLQLFSVWLTFVLLWMGVWLFLEWFNRQFHGVFGGLGFENDGFSGSLMWLAFQLVSGMTFGDVVPVDTGSRILCSSMGFMCLVYRYLVIGHFSEIYWTHRRFSSNAERA